jgi:CheY-like chemotaxis protein
MRDMNDEHRRGHDRRRHARGGRRPEDRPGHTPLVMVVDADERRRDLTEAILARLRFAVAPVDSVEKAIAIAHALRPSVIVCSPDHADHLRSRLTTDAPIVEVPAAMAVTDRLLELVRSALRSAV